MDLSEATKCDLFEKKLDSHVIVVPGLYLKQTRGMETTIALFITTDDIRSLLLFTDCRCLLKSISIADATFDISYGRAWSCFCFAVWNENVGAQDMHKVFIWCYGHIPKGLINIFNFFGKCWTFTISLSWFARVLASARYSSHSQRSEHSVIMHLEDVQDRSRSEANNDS